MQLGRVTGKVVATRKLDSIANLKMLIVQPLDQDKRPMGKEIVAIDTVQAGQGDTVFFVTGREASFPLPEAFNPVDATIIGIVDSID
jgi:ethanolamine utilization protein EutN